MHGSVGIRLYSCQLYLLLCVHVQVCQQFSISFFALKSITDIVDGEHKTESEFYANLEKVNQLQYSVNSVWLTAL